MYCPAENIPPAAAHLVGASTSPSEAARPLRTWGELFVLAYFCILTSGGGAAALVAVSLNVFFYLQENYISFVR